MSEARRETKGESKAVRKLEARRNRKAAHPPQIRYADLTLPSREGGKKGNGS